MAQRMTSPQLPSPLCSHVLVLNRYYLAAHVVNVRRAFGLLYRQLAEVLDVEDGHWANYDFGTWVEISLLRAEEKSPQQDWIRSVNFEIQVPRVIRLLRYDKSPRRTLRFNRRNVFARDDHCCQYCGKSFPASELSMDHVVPRSRGGQTTWENVVCCCLKCNARKGGRTPQEARMSLLQPPKTPTQSPLLAHRLNNPKYATWRYFLGNSSATVDVA